MLAKPPGYQWLAAAYYDFLRSSVGLLQCFIPLHATRTAAVRDAAHLGPPVSVYPVDTTVTPGIRHRVAHLALSSHASITLPVGFMY